MAIYVYHVISSLESQAISLYATIQAGVWPLNAFVLSCDCLTSTRSHIPVLTRILIDIKIIVEHTLCDDAFLIFTFS